MRCDPDIKGQFCSVRSYVAVADFGCNWGGQMLKLQPIWPLYSCEVQALGRSCMASLPGLCHNNKRYNSRIIHASKFLVGRGGGSAGS